FDNLGTGVHTYSLGIFSDSSGTPGTLLGFHSGTTTLTAPTPGTANWNNQTITSGSGSVSITSGTAYWLAVQLTDDSPFEIRSHVYAGTQYEAFRNGCAVGTWGTINSTAWTGVCTTAQATSDNEIGIYATINMSGLTDTYNNSVLRIGTSGTATF